MELSEVISLIGFSALFVCFILAAPFMLLCGYSWFMNILDKNS